MKKTIAALLLVCVLALGMTGCIGNFYKDALTIDGETISSGMYLMAQLTAYTEARNMVEDPEKVLKEKIEDQSAKDWIRTRAEELCRRYVCIDRLSNEMGVTLSSEGQQNIDSMMQYWDYMEERYTNNGISQATVMRFTRNDELSSELFKAMYAEGGPLEVPDEELKQEYGEKYAHIRFFSVPTSKLEPTVDMTAEVTVLAEAMVKRLEGGATLEDVVVEDVEEVYTLLEREVGTSDTVENISNAYVDLFPDNFETYTEEFLTHLKDQALGDFGYYDMGATIIIYEKVELFADDTEYESRKQSVLQSLKRDDFEEYLETVYQEYPVSWEFGAKTYFSPSKIKY